MCVRKCVTVECVRPAVCFFSIFIVPILFIMGYNHLLFVCVCVCPTPQRCSAALCIVHAKSISITIFTWRGQVYMFTCGTNWIILHALSNKCHYFENWLVCCYSLDQYSSDRKTFTIDVCSFEKWSWFIMRASTLIILYQTDTTCEWS